MATEQTPPTEKAEASDQPIVIRRLLEAWAEMQQFGNGHEGECDNSDCCETCGSKLNGCSLHIAKVNERTNAMQDAVDAVARTYG